MENAELLSLLIKSLRRKQAVLDKERATLQKEISILMEQQQLIADQMSEKERELCLITDHAIDNYKSLWQSLAPGDRLPCPFCYLLHQKKSPLVPLLEDDSIESVKCSVCGEIFYVPVI